MKGRRGVFSLLTKLIFLELVDRIVWLDETGFRPWMQRTHGRAKKGVRVQAKGRARSTQYTLVAAMDLHGIRAKLVFPKGLTTERWKRFVRDHLLPSLRPGELLLLDNLNIHTRAQEELMALRAVGVGVLFLPPYSPQANPIEDAFSCLKTAVRADFPKTAAQLRASIDRALASLSPKHFLSFIAEAFKHASSW